MVHYCYDTYRYCNFVLSIHGDSNISHLHQSLHCTTHCHIYSLTARKIRKLPLVFLNRTRKHFSCLVWLPCNKQQSSKWNRDLDLLNKSVNYFTVVACSATQLVSKGAPGLKNMIRAKHMGSKNQNAKYWNLARVRQHKNVLRNLEGMCAKFSFQLST